MAEYRIEPKGFFNFLAKKSDEERGKALLTMAIAMVEGKTSKQPWITRIKSKSKKSIGTYTEDFLTFWKQYPKKVGKGAAFAIWSDLEITLYSTTMIMDTLEWQCRSADWTKDNGQYIPNPETYLRQRRFEDEPDTTSKKAKTIAKVY